MQHTKHILCIQRSGIVIIIRVHQRLNKHKICAVEKKKMRKTTTLVMSKRLAQATSSVFRPSRLLCMQKA